MSLSEIFTLIIGLQPFIYNLYFMFLCYILLLALSLNLVSLQDPLLKISNNSECIKNVIDNFIQKQTCQKLTQTQKLTLAIEMTNCLNLKLGKKTVPKCEDFTKCEIRGDDWNTFTKFYTHIDNLCHFYWDLLHHERAESLIGGLSESAFVAEDILKKNYRSTEKILQVQETINEFMLQSLSSNEKLSESLKNSEIKIQNMTQQIEGFLGQLNKNLISQYSSIVQVMSTINEGVEGMSTVQAVMMSEIDTISGLLYFLLQILMIGLLTSFAPFKRNRAHSVSIYALNILIELLSPEFVRLLIGIRIIRLFFVALHIINLLKAFTAKQDNFDQIKLYMDRRLDTNRIKRIFKEIAEEGKTHELKEHSVDYN